MPYISGVDIAAQRAFGFKEYPIEMSSFIRKSFNYSITGGQTLSFSEKFTVDTYLFGGAYVIDGVVADGDYIEFTITDEDNLLGYGAGFVLAKYVEKEYISPSRPFDTIEREGAKKIPAGLYYTFKYVNVGVSPVNDIKAKIRYFIRKA